MHSTRPWSSLRPSGTAAAPSAAAAAASAPLRRSMVTFLGSGSPRDRAMSSTSARPMRVRPAANSASRRRRDDALFACAEGMAPSSRALRMARWPRRTHACSRKRMARKHARPTASSMSSWLKSACSMDACCSRFRLVPATKARAWLACTPMVWESWDAATSSMPSHGTVMARRLLSSAAGMRQASASPPSPMTRPESASPSTRHSAMRALSTRGDGWIRADTGSGAPGLSVSSQTSGSASASPMARRTARGTQEPPARTWASRSAGPRMLSRNSSMRQPSCWRSVLSSSDRARCRSSAVAPGCLPRRVRSSSQRSRSTSSRAATLRAMRATRLRSARAVSRLSGLRASRAPCSSVMNSFSWQPHGSMRSAPTRPCESREAGGLASGGGGGARGSSGNSFARARVSSWRKEALDARALRRSSIPSSSSSESSSPDSSSSDGFCSSS
mmetsp:Transcript_26507/g.77952  ORF Transcript_26507/g.77952 Transcript_26507/m.77952 type:complete len:446 (+) Transcript_26507:418-1755(+)